MPSSFGSSMSIEGQAVCSARGRKVDEGHIKELSVGNTSLGWICSFYLITFKK